MRTRNREWFNTKTHKALYGVQVFCSGQWMNVANGNKPALFDTEEERDALRKELQARKMAPHE
ncbi:MAG TPA: hypothetical protein VGC24_03065 [Burkholderiaceae bacterium]